MRPILKGRSADRDRSDVEPPDVEAHLERIVDGHAIGWARNRDEPESRVEVEAFVDGRPVAKAIADLKRPGLAKAGIGDGHYGFRIALPERLASSSHHTLRVVAGPHQVPAAPHRKFVSKVRSAGTVWDGVEFTPEVVQDEAAASAVPGDAEITAHLEEVVDGAAIGWAWAPEHPDARLPVEAVVDGRTVAEGVAGIERPSLVEAGIGDGRYGFHLRLPKDLISTPAHTIKVLVGPASLAAKPHATFASITRAPESPWEGVEFVPEGSRLAPYLPAEEPSPDPGAAALVGREGWLFVRDDNHLTLEHLTGQPLLSPEAIRLQRDLVAERYEQLKRLGVPYVFAPAPVKDRVYGEMLPDGVMLDPARPVARLNEALLDLNCGDALDLLPALLHARPRGALYHRIDSRWNDFGALVASRALLREADRWLLALEPPLPEEAKLITVSDFRGDLSAKPKFELVRGRFRPHRGEERWNEPEQVDEVDPRALRARRMPPPDHLMGVSARAPHLYELPDDQDSPRAMLIGDAFCLPLIPWLAEHFRRFVFVWASELPLEEIELEMPDVLFHVTGETYLRTKSDGG